jgi:hypothetical protein
MRAFVAVDDWAIDDAINVANVIADCVGSDADADLRGLAVAAKRLVRELGEQARELERERARRRSPSQRTSLVDGASLRDGTDGGGWRQYVAGRPVHAGDTLFLLTSLGWYPTRYESDVSRMKSVLYLSLPGVHDEIAITLPREARFAWPDELKCDGSPSARLRSSNSALNISA